MKKFKTPVAMEVTQEQYDRDLKQPLLDLGYVEKKEYRFTRENFSILQTNSDKGYSLFVNSHNEQPYYIPTYNPELFLALAGMTEGDIISQKEWTYYRETCYNGILLGSSYFPKATKEQLINHFSKEVMEKKKYRIKEQYRLAFQNTWHDAILTLEQWKANGLSIEALEEVEQRVELIKYTIDPDNKGDLHFLNKVDNKIFTYQEKDLCEKALNGELLDIESLDDVDFKRWFRKSHLSLHQDGMKAVLKEYLKQL